MTATTEGANMTAMTEGENMMEEMDMAMIMITPDKYMMSNYIELKFILML